MCFLAPGQALFTWNALDHVNPNMSYADPGSTGTAANNAFDYIHLNAIGSSPFESLT